MTWEYIAGFFDGEGSILGYLKSPRVSIAQKRTQVLLDIQKFLWSKDIRSQIFQYNNGKVAQLRVNATNEVISFVEGVFDFLIVKKEECETALKILKARDNKRKKWRLSELKKLKELREEGKTAKEISSILGRPFRTVAAYCYREGKFARRFDLIGFTNKL